MINQKASGQKKKAELVKSFFLQMLTIQNLKSFIWKLFRTLLIIGLAFMILFPLITKVSRSFMTWQDLNDITVYYIPRLPTLDNFITEWNGINYPKALLSAGGITLMVALLQTISCTLVAYGLARFKFAGNRLIFMLVMVTFLIPSQTILMPLYLKFRYFDLFRFFITGGIMSGVSLINTLWPFIILSATALAFKSGLYIYLLRQFFTNMPSVLEEAAYIDGCGNLKTFSLIMLPNAVPMIITTFLFSFVWQWNDYSYTAMLAPNLPTLPMKMLAFKSLLNANLMGETVVMTQGPLFLLLIIPLLMLYIFTQRYFVESITRSGIVG